MTPVKDSKSRSPKPESCGISENENPNVNFESPLKNPSNSPLVKSAKSKKSNTKVACRVESSPKKIQQRKFIVAKKKSKKSAPTVLCKCKDRTGDQKKCLCVAYESLRVSQEEFFQKSCEELKTNASGSREGCKSVDNIDIIQNNGAGKVEDEQNKANFDEFDRSDKTHSTRVRKMRSKLLEDVMNVVPEQGSGRVMHLVKAFESLLTVSDHGSNEIKVEEKNEESKITKWALPGLQLDFAEKTESVESKDDNSGSDVSSSSSSVEFLFKAKRSDNSSRDYSSLDSTEGSLGGTRISNRGRRSRRNSSDTSSRVGGMKWKKVHTKATNQQPFNLRTEQRGRVKEEEFLKKVQQMFTEEEKKRIPIAQGLPWTTDEPECIVKPLVKENTRPLDIKLHTVIRAIDRAEFDHHIEEKLCLMEQYRLERERRQKLEEEDEIRRMRRELVPKAQPMPYFDRPFIPKRSDKQLTIPREPKFHIPQQKRVKCLSWDDLRLSSRTEA